MDPIKIENITPEKLVEIDEAAKQLKLKDMTMHSLAELADQRESAIAHYRQIELQCRTRALRAVNLGFKKSEVAKIFNVTSNTITKWIGK